MTGEDLRESRQSWKLTQTGMGEKLGVAANTIARWERDELAIPHWVPLLVACYSRRAYYTSGIEPPAANAATRGCHVFHENLLAEVKRLRRDADARRGPDKWYPDNCVKADLLRIINFMEDEIRNFDQHGLSVKTREKARTHH